MSVEAEMPITALFIGEDGINSGIVQKQHLLVGLTFVVLVDRIDQRCSHRRRVSLRDYGHAVINRRTQGSQRFLILAFVVITLNNQIVRAVSQLDTAACIDTFRGPDQIAKHGLSGVGKGTGQAFDQRDAHRRLGNGLRLGQQ